MRQTITLLWLPKIEVRLLVPVKTSFQNEESRVKSSVEVAA
jgi:hypothetical protein